MFKTWNVLNPVALVTTQLEKKLKKMGNVKNPLEWERAVKFTIYELIQSEKIKFFPFFFLPSYQICLQIYYFVSMTSKQKMRNQSFATQLWIS